MCMESGCDGSCRSVEDAPMKSFFAPSSDLGPSSIFFAMSLARCVADVNGVTEDMTISRPLSSFSAETILRTSRLLGA
eukprot:COSAG06_NODE_29840_length_549_cov_2.177778_2_plen_78_part_00